MKENVAATTHQFLLLRDCKDLRLNSSICNNFPYTALSASHSFILLIYDLCHDVSLLSLVRPCWECIPVMMRSHLCSEYSGMSWSIGTCQNISVSVSDEHYVGLVCALCLIFGLIFFHLVRCVFSGIFYCLYIDHETYCLI
jgi:hypothetical protein